jgi:hypothetical protein
MLADLEKLGTPMLANLEKPMLADLEKLGARQCWQIWKS